MVLCGSLVSCSIIDSEWKAIKEVTVSAEDILSGNADTRSGFDLADNKLTFYWTKGDQIGIFPTTEGDSQVALTIKSGAGTNTAKFTGGGWALRDDITYVAYYPYQVGAFLGDILFSYEGQLQTGNATLAHLGTHDFMVTPLTSTVEGALNFSFTHLNSIAQLVLTVPDAASFKSVSLRCDEAVFAKTARLSLSGPEYSFGQSEATDRLTMQLSEVATTEENKTLTLYMNLFPFDMSGHTIRVVLHSENNRVYEGTLLSKNLRTGKAYSFAASMIDVTMNMDIASPSFGESNNEI